MSTERPEPELHDEPPGTAGKQDASHEWLQRWMAEQDVAASARPWRLSHMMGVVAAIAVVLWLVVTMGAVVVVGGIVLLFAMAIGAGVILARRRSTQQDSLLVILAIAAEGNMPLAPTVAAFADQYRGKYRRRIMNLAAELDSGRSVPEALENVRRVVSRDALLLARVGDQTGRLPQALRMAASSRSSQLPIWTAIATRLAYLLAMLLIMQSVCGFMMYFIVPKFEAIFKDFGVPLPQSTSLLIEGSHFIMNFGLVTAWIPPLELLLLIFLPFSFAGWVNYDVPFFDRFLKRRHMALILRALSLAVDAGKPIEVGLTTLASHYPTLWVRRKLIKVDDHVQLGESWISALERQRIIQTSDAQVLTSASEVGNLAWALGELAETGERRLAFRFQAVIQTLFPLVVLGLGLVVMFVAVAFFSPLVVLLGRLSG
ncbi:MAG TPA: type II secretion system F family protein [Isosphaeraceae bacterium]|nr:type II secretion system F family protein [Isosphaeraceae bacterium]